MNVKQLNVESVQSSLTWSALFALTSLSQKLGKI